MKAEEVKEIMVKNLEEVIPQVVDMVIAHLLKNEMCDDAFQLLHDALDAECEVADYCLKYDN